MNYNKIDNMRTFFLFLMLTLPLSVISQTWINDSNFEDKINTRSAFGDDDDASIVVVEFWAKFNQNNAFAEWKKLKNAQYYRIDIAKCPNTKKEYRVRMAPTVIIFHDGVKFEVFKAGLDLLLPASLEDIQGSIDEARKSSHF